MGRSAEARNLETVEAGYDDFAARDLDSVLGFFDPDIEWIVAEGFPYGGTYHGPEAVRTGVFENLAESVAEFEVIPDRFIDAGQTVVVLGRYNGVSGETGKAFTDVPWAHVWDFEDGMAVRFQQYTDTALVQAALTD